LTPLFSLARESKVNNIEGIIFGSQLNSIG
jgi:hypothetical protein